MDLQRRVSQQNAALDRHLKQIGFLNQMSTEFQYSDSLEQTFEIVTQYVQVCKQHNSSFANSYAIL